MAPPAITPHDVRTTSAGPVELPIVYREASVITAVFRVPPGRVAAVLGDLRLEPVRIAGKTTVVLTIFEYRDTSVGPYNELGLSSYVRPIDDPRLRAAAFWVHALPVTTPLACAAGLEIWGLPKWVTPINFAVEADSVRAGLPGDVELVMPRRGGPAVPVTAPFTTFSELNGRLIRTRVSQRSGMRFRRSRRTTLRITRGGRVADLLERLGCAETRPVFGIWCERFESSLPGGVLLGASRPSPQDSPVRAAARTES